MALSFRRWNVLQEGISIQPHPRGTSTFSASSNTGKSTNARHRFHVFVPRTSLARTVMSRTAREFRTRRGEKKRKKKKKTQSLLTERSQL